MEKPEKFIDDTRITHMAIGLTSEEMEALNRKMRDSGQKKYRLVREAIVQMLTRENYLPKQQA